ncbi:hypothetical protein C0V74_10075 [Altererythrobacter sp. TH136]|nr:hypothetical protein C0V74_10075 [Altererythrobacter sp. TH136]
MEKASNNPMHSAPRCLARTRSGTECQSPAIKGRNRCRMHGGQSPGAPKGNNNALKHGRYSADTLLLAAELRSILRRGLAALD